MLLPIKRPSRKTGNTDSYRTDESRTTSDSSGHADKKAACKSRRLSGEFLKRKDTNSYFSMDMTRDMNNPQSVKTDSW